VRKVPTRYLQVVQPKSKLAVWAWSPVIVLRIALVSTYMFYVYASVIAFLVGVPLFELTTPRGWTAIWAILLGASGVVAAVGSLSDRWQMTEKWATMCLSALILSYIIPMNILGFLAHDLNRQFVGIIALIAGLLPITRFIYLAAQSGKKKQDGSVVG
jgi:hypothetical protein